MDKGRIMQLNEMKPNRTIKNPHWTNDKKIKYIVNFIMKMDQ